MTLFHGMILSDGYGVVLAVRGGVKWAVPRWVFVYIRQLARLVYYTRVLICKHRLKTVIPLFAGAVSTGVTNLKGCFVHRITSRLQRAPSHVAFFPRPPS